MYDRSDRFFPLIIRSMRRHKDVSIYGKEKLLDFTYIDDCVVGIMRAIKRFPAVKNNTFNIASGKGEFLVRVAGMLKKQLKSKSRIIVKPVQQGEVVRYVADIAKARKLLGFRPSFSLKDGLDAAIRWYAHEKHRIRS